jgi:hypothetical protein
MGTPSTIISLETVALRPRRLQADENRLLGRHLAGAGSPPSAGCCGSVVRLIHPGSRAYFQWHRENCFRG